MSNGASAHPPSASVASSESSVIALSRMLIVETRHGRREAGPGALISVPRGLIGFSAHKRFVLLAPPPGKSKALKLFQAVDRADLGLYVLAGGADHPDFEQADIVEAAHELGIDGNNLAILLIVTVHTGDGAAELTANLRAPIFLDQVNRVAHQHVMANEAYPLRKRLG